MLHLFRALSFILLLATASSAGASAPCLVVGISDGDTLTARCGVPGSYQQVKVRLAEIDAPEKAQAFGHRSKEALSDLCFHVVAEVHSEGTDRYGRTIARVTCRGRDASAAQLQSGMAWVFTRYAKDPALPPLEREARAARAGLWRDAEPVPPWERRHRR